MTREQMEERYSAIPPVIGEGSFTWTIHRSHASVSFTTEDRGETWTRRGIVYAGERQRRDNESLEMQRIQRELK